MSNKLRQKVINTLVSYSEDHTDAEIVKHGKDTITIYRDQLSREYNEPQMDSEKASYAREQIEVWKGVIEYIQDVQDYFAGKFG